MSGSHSGADRADERLLSEGVERALDAPPWRLRFEPLLEARFEADTRGGRSRYTRRMAWVGLAMYALFLITDALLVPDVLDVAVACRLGLAVSGSVAGAFILRAGVRRCVQDLAVVAFMTAAACGILLIYFLSESAAKVIYPNGVMLTVVFGALCLRPSFAYAMAGCLTCTVVTIAVLPAHGVTFPVVAAQSALMVASVVAIALAAFRLESQERTNYLLRWRDKERRISLEQSNQRLLRMAQYDVLTGIPNRRALDHALAVALDDAARNDRSVAVVLIDVDHFKHYNDTYGHLVGDDCLRYVASCLSACIGMDGSVGRYGGEEFMAVVVDRDRAYCLALAERMRERVAHWQSGPGGPLPVTVSCGVAWCAPGTVTEAARLIEQADIALYRSKGDGRNRVSFLEGVP